MQHILESRQSSFKISVKESILVKTKAHTRKQVFHKKISLILIALIFVVTS